MTSLDHEHASENFATFWEHVEVLRSHILVALFIIIIGFASSFLFYPSLLNLLKTPLHHTNSSLDYQEFKRTSISNRGDRDVIYSLPEDVLHVITLTPGVQEISPHTYQIPPKGFIEFEKCCPIHNLVIFGPLEGMISTLKICFWIGLVGTSPFWLFVLFKFFIPGLLKREKSFCLLFISLSLLFAVLGFLFAFFVTIPIANEFLQAFNQEIGTNLWSLEKYLDYTINILLGSGLAFELGLLLILLVYFGFLSASWMSKQRRVVILFIFVLSAILTPPDVLSQLMLAIPLLGLYELAILYAKLRIIL